MQDQTQEGKTMTVAELKRTMTAGRRFEVTNHYLPEDHKSGCGGTTVRTVVRANTTGVYLSIPNRPDVPEGSFVSWPKAAQLEAAGDAFSIYGGGAAQGDRELFLTVRPLAEEVAAA